MTILGSRQIVSKEVLMRGYAPAQVWEQAIGRQLRSMDEKDREHPGEVGDITIMLIHPSADVPDAHEVRILRGDTREMIHELKGFVDDLEMDAIVGAKK
jgi:hypothetical protein